MERRPLMSPLLVVVTIVLVDLLGFSLVMPLLPRYAEQYGFDERMIGALFAAFPLCQLIAGPVLGGLSDRFGRRPILLLSQIGTTASFLMIGLTETFVIMLLGRMLDGFSGGNILVAQAYIADVTKPENRARGLGMIGMPSGLASCSAPCSAECSFPCRSTPSGSFDFPSSWPLASRRSPGF